MTLTYQATLEDCAEPHIRHFLRGKTARYYRMRSTVIGVLTGGVACLFIFRDRGPGAMLAAALIGGAAGAAINYWTFIPQFKRRFKKSLLRDQGDKIPAEVLYVVEPGEVQCTMNGVTTTFRQKDLENISEDAERVELSFGKAGLCLIPLRAFRDEAEKARFLDALGGGNPGKGFALGTVST